MQVFTIAGICGSLRKGSYNRLLLKAAAELLPQDARLQVMGLEDIPPFNADLEPDMPLAVREFKARVRAADAVLFATPEYNYSVPGVLKNAIDWASRPSGDNSWQGKPVALMSASSGMLGGFRAQYHLRQTFVYLDVHPINRPEVMVSFAKDKFDRDGRFTDETGRRLIAQLLDNLVAWGRRIK